MRHPWVLVTGDFVRQGGQDRANYELARHLLERGEEVHLVAHRIDPSLSAFPSARAHRVPRPGGSHELGQPWLDWAGRKVAREVTASSPGARVIVNGGNCRWPDVSWIHCVHAAWPVSDSGAPAWAKLKHRISKARARRGERRVLARARLLIANSERTRTDLVERLGIEPERVRVVRLGLDAAREPVSEQARARARARFGLSEHEPVVLFVGALGYDRNKGFDLLLEAWRRLCARRFTGRLLAVGEGRLGFWQSQANALGVADTVRLLGQIPNLPELLPAADLVVCPSRYEAFGLFAQEALARGIPALVSARAGVAELYPPQLSELLLASVEDVNALAEAMARCLEGRASLLPRVAELGQALRSQTWQRMAEQMVDAIQTPPS